jgi:hypothetical protein
MTAAHIIAELDRIDRERAALMKQLRTAFADNPAGAPDAPSVEPAQPEPVDYPTDLIPAGAAAALARRAKSTVNTWCRKNAIDGDAGFAIKLGSRWFVSKSRLLKYLGAGQAI